MSCVQNEVYKHIKGRNFKKALNILKTSNNKHWIVSYLTGFCNRKIGDYELAIENYRESFSSSPDSALVFNAMGIPYQDLGMLEEAEYCFESSSTIISRMKHFSSPCFEVDRKILRSDALNNLGVTLQLKHNLSKHLATLTLQFRSLTAHQVALSLFEKTIEIQASLRLQNLALNNKYILADRDISANRTILLNKIRYETPAWTALQINLAAQYSRVGEFKKSKECISNCISTIDEQHSSWTKVRNLQQQIESLSTLH